MAQNSPVKISVTIITFNEGARLARCLKALSWASEIIVVDTFSTDNTKAIAQSFGAKVFDEKWHGYGAQKNIAMAHATGDWILNIDADEVITPDLRDEILARIQQPGGPHGYAVARKTFYMGRWIRHGGWYPNYVVRLCRKGKAQWTEPAVHEELRVDGGHGYLEKPLEHYTFDSIEDQVRTNIRYAKEGALQQKKSKGSFQLWRLLAKPLSKFIETYIVKLGFLDGLPGFVISINAAHSMFLKQAFHFELDQEAFRVEKGTDIRQPT
jgi:glycosyltransferase involved in cell wall biosynthesis